MSVIYTSSSRLKNVSDPLDVKAHGKQLRAFWTRGLIEKCGGKWQLTTKGLRAWQKAQRT